MTAAARAVPCVDRTVDRSRAAGRCRRTVHCSSMSAESRPIRGRRSMSRRRSVRTAPPEHHPLDQVDRNRTGSRRPGRWTGSKTSPSATTSRSTASDSSTTATSSSSTSRRRGRTPLDRLAIGVPYQDESNVTRWQGGAAASAAAGTPGSCPTTPSRIGTRTVRIRPLSRRGCPSTACACTGSRGFGRPPIRSRGWAAPRWPARNWA